MLYNRTRLVIAVGLCALLSVPVMAATTLGIVTGPKPGTYFAIGRDIAQAAHKAGIAIDVKSSEGSFDNIRRINSGENAALGIVQSDVLGFLSRSQSPASMRLASNLRMVFPLYKEEVHVLARKEISSFAELAGKKVAVGEQGSGNMLTAINLFAIMGITPASSEKMTSEAGLVAVLRGDLDAVIFVGGKPVRMFKNLEDLTTPEHQKYALMLQEVHFLPLDDLRMLHEYAPAKITHSDYSFVNTDVPTLAVRAVLVSFDFSKADDKKRCVQLHTLASVLRHALPELQRDGHPKWKEVDFDADPGIWQKDNCVWNPPKADEPKHKKVHNKHYGS